jgi:hypothetical protein
LAQTIEVVVRLTVSEEDFDANRLEERGQPGRDEAGLAAPPGAVRQRALGHHPGAGGVPALAGEGGEGLLILANV